MSRHIAPATPAFTDLGNSIHPESAGGFNANSIEGIKRSIGSVDMNNTDAHGVVRLDSNGKAILDGKIVTNSTVTLDGPDFFSFDNDTEYTITNFSSFKDYHITTEPEIAFSRNNEKITIPAGIQEERIKLNINGRAIYLARIASRMSSPDLKVNGSAVGNTTKIHVAGGYFTSGDVGNLEKIEVQVFSDALGINSILSEVVTTSLTDVVIEAPYAETYHVRARYIDSRGFRSEWSEIVSVARSTFSSDVSKPIIHSQIYKDQEQVSFRLNTTTPAAFSDVGAVRSVTWQVSADSTFTNIVRTVDDTSDNKFYSYFTENLTDDQNLFVRTRVVFNNGTVSQWSDTEIINGKNKFSAMPVFEYGAIGSGHADIHFIQNDSKLFISRSQGQAAIYDYEDGILRKLEEIDLRSAIGQDIPRLIQISKDGLTLVLTGFADGSDYKSIIVKKINNVWTLFQTLINPEGTTGALYCGANSICKDGSTIVFSTRSDSRPFMGRVARGGVLIYELINGSYQLVYTHSPDYGSPDTILENGRTMAISEDGNLVIANDLQYGVGAMDGEGSFTIINKINGQWIPEATIYSPNRQAGAWFGLNPIINGNNDLIVVSAHAEHTNNYLRSGALYIYRKINNIWTYTQKIGDSNDLPIFASRHVGSWHRLSTNGRLLITNLDKGANTPEVTNGSASIAVYKWDGTKFTLFKLTDFDKVGLWVSAVSINGDYMVIADSAQYFIFGPQKYKYQNMTRLYSPVKGLNDGFGISAVLVDDGETLFAGSHLNPINGAIYRGLACIFKKVNNAWVLHENISDSRFGNHLGYEIKRDISGNNVFIGFHASTITSDYWPAQGHILHYKRESPGNWVRQPDITIHQLESNVLYFSAFFEISEDGKTLIATGTKYESTNSSAIGYTGVILRNNNGAWVSELFETTLINRNGQHYFNTGIAMINNGSYALFRSLRIHNEREVWGLLLYKRRTDGTWYRIKEITATDFNISIDELDTIHQVVAIPNKNRFIVNYNTSSHYKLDIFDIIGDNIVLVHSLGDRDGNMNFVQPIKVNNQGDKLYTINKNKPSIYGSYKLVSVLDISETAVNNGNVRVIEEIDIPAYGAVKQLSISENENTIAAGDGSSLDANGYGSVMVMS